VKENTDSMPAANIRYRFLNKSDLSDFAKLLNASTRVLLFLQQAAISV
jgi:hypothetical protein